MKHEALRFEFQERWSLLASISLARVRSTSTLIATNDHDNCAFSFGLFTKFGALSVVDSSSSGHLEYLAGYVERRFARINSSILFMFLKSFVFMV